MGHDTASPRKLYQLFKGTCCPYLQGFKVHNPLTQHHIPKPPAFLIKWLWKPLKLTIKHLHMDMYGWGWILCLSMNTFPLQFRHTVFKVHHQWCRTSSVVTPTLSFISFLNPSPSCPWWGHNTLYLSLATHLCLAVKPSASCPLWGHNTALLPLSDPPTNHSLPIPTTSHAYTSADEPMAD
jgi:hypothetical protein